MASQLLSVPQNAARNLPMHFTDAAGADINITGKTVSFYVAKGIDTANLISKTIISHSDPTHGKTVVPLSAADTNIDAQGYKYEVWLDDSPSDIGTFVIRDTLRGQ